jgi:polysaccharide biosynthesis protein PslG
MPGPPRRLGNLARSTVALALTLALFGALAPSVIGQALTAEASAAPITGVNGLGLPGSAGARELSLVRKLHAKIIRIEVGWSGVEPNGPGVNQTQQVQTDRFMAAAAAAGVRVVMTVDSTPCWASSAPASLLSKCRPGRLSAANAYPPRNPADYAAFTAYLAKRYGPDLAALEIWNEPDQANQLYFAGPEKPARYAALLRAAYPAIKAVDPTLPVLAGSLVGSNGVFLRLLYAAGIKGYYDGLSVHFYNLVLGSLRSIHEVQLANGDDKPLWLAEFGWTSCYPKRQRQEEQACVTPSVQAANLANVVRSLARTPYMAAVIVYDLRDSPGENFGVLNSAGGQKASFKALASAFASPFGRTSSVTVSLSTRRGHTVASGSGPVGDFMELEASQGGVLRYQVLFTLNRFNRYSITLPSVLGTKGLQVHVYQYWSGLAHGAQASN